MSKRPRRDEMAIWRRLESWPSWFPTGCAPSIGLETCVQDVRYAFRTLRKSPGFTAVAALTLALGIGSATTISSAIQNILLDPFPYTDAQRVVAIQIHDTAS